MMSTLSLLLFLVWMPLGCSSWQDPVKLYHQKTRSLLSDVLKPSNESKPSFYYRDNQELELSLKSISKRCRNITRLYSIGRSSLGYPLWVLEISDKPGELEAKPAFKYVGNLHGDEPVGRELLLYLGKWLCDSYRKDPLATHIVEGVHLHLLPSMNPDGYKLRSRNNANNIDLNRDFPDQFFPQNNNEAHRQPETRAIMEWSRRYRFVASASLHEGALVANYPWDGSPDGRTKYSMCDDDKTFRYLAKIYSGAHVNMSRSSEFPEGITNGAAWYPLYGGMQDWNYIHGKCMDLTLELNDEKWPPAVQLGDIWEKNRQSMLLLVASLLQCGIRGKVVSASDGKAIAASITVKGINFTVIAGETYGDYYRLLSPGNYEVTANMSNYKSQTVKVVVHEGKVTHVNFKLEGFSQATTTIDSELEELDNSTDSRYFTFKRKKTVSSFDRDIFAGLVISHMKIVSISLMFFVFLLFTFFTFRNRCVSRTQKQNKQHARV